MTDSYRTISKPGTSLYKVKGSKHHGYAFSAKDEDEINVRLEEVKKEHHSARHVSYAWRLDPDGARFRANDDGEPSNSAGMPILGQIEKYDLTNVLVAVVRYFGGTKLGVGGLIDAYRTAAQEAIENATIKTLHITAYYRLHFGYDHMGDVMLVLRTRDWEASDQDFRESCKLTVSIPPEKEEELCAVFAGFPDIRVEPLGTKYEL
ncbi:MAG: IMPACT family protein [Flavobacteriales bacterium]|nr:IMPACT family protein [Flavobacteriales bacterium]